MIIVWELVVKGVYQTMNHIVHNYHFPIILVGIDGVCEAGMAESVCLVL